MIEDWRKFVRLSAGDCLAKVFMFAGLAHVARLLGAHEFGRLAWAQSIIAYVCIVAEFGLTTCGLREIAKRPSTVRWYLKIIIRLRCLCSGITLLAIAG